MYKLDKKDKDILYELDLNSRQSFNQIGRKIKLSKEVVQYRIKQLEKVKIKFIIAKNAIVTPGSKTAYVRILQANGNVISLGTDDSYKFKSEGEDLVYSQKRDFDYSGDEQELTVYYAPKDKLTAGKFKIEVYVDGALSGTGSMELK